MGITIYHKDVVMIGGEPMKELVILEIFKRKKVAEFDITDASFKEMVELAAIQRKHGRFCEVKQVFIEEEVTP